MEILVGLFAAFLIGAGAAAYAGRWRSWASADPTFFYAIGFGILYLGIAVGLFAVLSSLGDILPLAAQRAGAVTVFALLGVTLLSFFWLPRALTPTWFREARTRRPSSQR
ncbi:hypothetical protein [Microbacterium kunmingense]|uniref:hypothetical protein n=1 Tax=Microbacterium kunmingense TaxID=2915939 RepID=UPI003D760D8C